MGMVFYGVTELLGSAQHAHFKRYKNSQEIVIKVPTHHSKECLVSKSAWYTSDLAINHIYKITQRARKTVYLQNSCCHDSPCLPPSICRSHGSFLVACMLCKKHFPCRDRQRVWQRAAIRKFMHAKLGASTHSSKCAKIGIVNAERYCAGGWCVLYIMHTMASMTRTARRTTAPNVISWWIITYGVTLMVRESVWTFIFENCTAV